MTDTPLEESEPDKTTFEAGDLGLTPLAPAIVAVDFALRHFAAFTAFMKATTGYPVDAQDQPVDENGIEVSLAMARQSIFMLEAMTRDLTFAYYEKGSQQS